MSEDKSHPDGAEFSFEAPEIISDGGIVDETSATLAIYGQDLEPDDISQELGVSPSSAHRRGDRHSGRGPAYKQGGWLLEVRGQAPTEPDWLVRSLLRRLPANPSVWEVLRNRYEVRIIIAVHMSAWNRGLTLEAETVKMLAVIGAPIDFDLYFDPDEAETEHECR